MSVVVARVLTVVIIIIVLLLGVGVRVVELRVIVRHVVAVEIVLGVVRERLLLWRTS